MGNDMPNLDLSGINFEKTFELANRASHEMHALREIEWREKEKERQWKEDVRAGISQANESLLEINQTFQSKLDSVNETLDLILNSIGGNFQRTERLQLLANQQLTELATLIENKDQKGIKAFLLDHGIEGVSLLVTLLSFLTKG